LTSRFNANSVKLQRH